MPNLITLLLAFLTETKLAHVAFRALCQRTFSPCSLQLNLSTSYAGNNIPLAQSFLYPCCHHCSVFYRLGAIWLRRSAVLTVPWESQETHGALNGMMLRPGQEREG